jgi:putative PIG3 family NAD(P)H quinone oxidoreductase
MSSDAHADLPDTMTAIEIPEPGGPGALKPGTREVPQPGEGEALIKVISAGVNRPDVMQRQGNYPPPPGASDIPGLEIAGRVVRLGPGVAGWKEGDETLALVTGGGYAEYCVAPAAQMLPIPKGVDIVEAGGIPETFFTVWTNVFDRGRLQRGESLLVHGGSSGIGTTAIQIARAMGARVFTTAGTVEKCAVCEDLGAERAINYREEDFVAVVKAATDKRGVDVVLDMVGGDYIQRNLSALAPDGRLCYIAFLGGSKAEVDFLPMMLKRITISGSTLRARDTAFKAKIAENLREHVWPLLESGKVKVVVHKTFPLTEASKAHALMESSAHIGKIVLTP